MWSPTPGRSTIAAVSDLIQMNATSKGQPLRLQKNADAMGSTCSIILYGHDARMMGSAMDAAFDELRRLDEMLSNYRPESEWSKLNRTAAQRPVKVSSELFQLLSACLQYGRQSEGAFDVTAGPLTKAWGFFKGEGRLPNEAEIAGALSAVGYQHLQLEPGGQTVRFVRAGMELDPGGMGKGYAVDRMVDLLRRRGFNNALIAASGSSIGGLGAPPMEPMGWPVDIRDPLNPRKLAAQVLLKDSSISTSGSSEKSFLIGGQVYSHIIDPRTGYPVKGSMSVSVIASSALESEVWTKSCLINGREWATSHKPAGYRILFCQGTPIRPEWLE